MKILQTSLLLLLLLASSSLAKIYSHVYNGSFEKWSYKHDGSRRIPNGWYNCGPDEYCGIVGNCGAIWTFQRMYFTVWGTWYLPHVPGDEYTYLLIPMDGKEVVAMGSLLHAFTWESSLTQYIHANKYDCLTGYYFFGTCEEPWHWIDMAYMTATKNGGMSEYVFFIDSSMVGYKSTHGWRKFTYVFPEDGSYKLKIQLTEDPSAWSYFPSVLVLDNFKMGKLADINFDGKIDFLDFGEGIDLSDLYKISEDWLWNYADKNRDNKVNLIDFAMFSMDEINYLADNWLKVY